MKHDRLFMDFALRVAQESKCKRKKVGAILVKDDMRVISIGYNGTPAGEDNCCEEPAGEALKTKDNVIHAEDNVYRKLLRSTETALGATLYCTCQPCEKCANLIIDSGTTRVVYCEEYRCTKGIMKLRDSGIVVEQLHYQLELINPLMDLPDPVKSPVPLCPPSPWVTPNLPGNCPKCGLELTQTMHYVCPNNPCPVGLGGIWCSTNESGEN